MRQDDPRMCDKNKNCKNGLDEEENTVCQPANSTLIMAIVVSGIVGSIITLTIVLVVVLVLR